MGSQIVTAIIEQRGQITTNPNGISPSPSAPVLQVAQAAANSQSIVQQVGPFITAFDTGGSFSKPILQAGPFVANDGSFPDETLIEQKVAGTAASLVRPGEAYDSPIQQVAFNNVNDLAQDASVSKVVEQRVAQRNLENGPLEQQANASNTVTVEQINFIELSFPPCGSTKNPVDTNILWRIRDFGFPFNVSTLIFTIDGIEVQDSTEFTITDLGNGLELFYNPPENFDFDATVQIYVEIQDTASPVNTFVARCVFRTIPDTRPPIVDNFGLCGQLNIGIADPLEFDIVDNGLGVDIDTLVLTVEGLPVCSGILVDPLTTVSGNGYHVTWEHPFSPFLYGSTISVAVEVSDLAEPPNSTFFICRFFTEESRPPEFMNFSPFPCESFVDTDTGLTFEVYGDVAGVDISTLEVRVDSALRKVIVKPRVLRSE